MEPDRVAIVNARPETILDDVARAMKLAGGVAQLVAAGPTVIVAAPDTPRWQAQAVGEVIRAAGGSVTTVSERQLLDDARAPAPAGDRSALRALMPDGVTVPATVAGRGLVLLPSLATDPAAGACRQLLAWLPRPPRLRGRQRSREVLAEVISLRREICPACLVVLDATVCGGIMTNVVMAGRDPVAVDDAAGRLVGNSPVAATARPLVGDPDACALRLSWPAGPQRVRDRESPWAQLRREWETR